LIEHRNINVLPQASSLQYAKYRGSTKMPQNMITNEEDNESESCLERGMLDNTEGEIVADLSNMREEGFEKIAF
jgi:hypothetical protein